MRDLLLKLPAIALLGLFASDAASAQGANGPRSLPEVVSSCEGCHGANGQTRSAEAPRLNAQTREYLIARLKDLRNPTNQAVSAIRAMRSPAHAISESDMAAAAEHFTAQSATSPNRPAQERRAGAQLYARGVAGRFPSCVSCHGDAGQGNGDAPRLAGQHGAYLQDQLEALMLTARVQPGMNRHAGRMMAEEIRALAAFLASD